MMSLCKLRSEIELVVEEYYMYDTRKFIQFNLVPGANGHNIVGQQLPTLLEVTCCIHLNTLLHAVGSCVQSLTLVKFLVTWKRIQQLPTILLPFALGSV